MTGRELYRKFCELSDNLAEDLRDGYEQMELSEQLAWEDLAAWIALKERLAIDAPVLDRLA